MTPPVRQLARDFRWGRRPLVPASAEPHRLPPEPPPGFDTRWARAPVARAAREVVLTAGLRQLVRAEVDPRVSGVDRLSGLRGPVVFAANHASHLDTAMILCTLPGEWRRRTLVAAAADYFFETWWRAYGTALAFGTVPLDRRGGTRHTSTETPLDLLQDGWSLLVFPEGTRSYDGLPGSYKSGAARLAMAAGVPIVPVGLRGTFAAMPRGRSWPLPGRPPVAVRYGDPLRSAPDENAKQLTDRLALAIRRLAVEDETTWWESLRAEPAAALPGRDAARWRRTWAATAPVARRAPRDPWR